MEASIVKFAIGINLLAIVRRIWLRVEGVKVARQALMRAPAGAGGQI